jgi:hypothetical protein
MRGDEHQAGLVHQLFHERDRSGLLVGRVCPL